MNVLVVTIAAMRDSVVDALHAVSNAGHVEVAGQADLDPALDRLAGRRLIVAGPPALLGDVLTRLLRRNELGSTPVGVIADLDRAACQVAVHGRPRPADLVRDDHGGVLVERAEFAPSEGRRLGARAYVDDVPIADGRVASVTVSVTGDGTLIGRASRPWRPGRARSATGRAVQVSCDEARLTVDGRAHPRPVTRRTWWVEPGRWLLVRP